EVKPVAGCKEDPVGVGGIDGDVEAGRKPAAGLAPGEPGVVGDDERRPAVDDGDHCRASGRGGHDAGQLELDLLVVDGLVHLVEDDFGLHVDTEDAVDRPNEGDHAAGAAVSSSTRAA